MISLQLMRYGDILFRSTLIKSPDCNSKPRKFQTEQLQNCFNQCLLSIMINTMKKEVTFSLLTKREHVMAESRLVSGKAKFPLEWRS